MKILFLELNNADVVCLKTRKVCASEGGIVRYKLDQLWLFIVRGCDYLFPHSSLSHIRNQFVFFFFFLSRYVLMIGTVDKI